MLNSNNSCLKERGFKHNTGELDEPSKHCYEYKGMAEKVQQLIKTILDDSPHKTAKNVLTKIINNNKIADKIRLRLEEDDLEKEVRTELEKKYEIVKNNIFNKLLMPKLTQV